MRYPHLTETRTRYWLDRIDQFPEREQEYLEQAARLHATDLSIWGPWKAQHPVEVLLDGRIRWMIAESTPDGGVGTVFYSADGVLTMALTEEPPKGCFERITGAPRIERDR